MNNLKQIRKAKYPYAKDFLPILAEHGVKYSIPEYSLFESGRALPTKANAATICKCLGCDVGDVEEFIVFGVAKSTAPYGEPSGAEKERMTNQAFSRFGALPPANPKRGFRMNEENWNKLMKYLNRCGYNTVGAFLKDALNTYGIHNPVGN